MNGTNIQIFSRFARFMYLLDFFYLLDEAVPIQFDLLGNCKTDLKFRQLKFVFFSPNSMLRSVAADIFGGSKAVRPCRKRSVHCRLE